jgi:hypothetical protein
MELAASKKLFLQLKYYFEKRNIYVASYTERVLTESRPITKRLNLISSEN